MTTAATPTGSSTRLLTIGAVCARVREEFPDISISKIRYLEDQGLLTPRRTRGGYRLFGEDDVERLQTILRLQRDEFLPLRVIREALDSPAAAGERTRRRAPRLGESEGEIDLDELCDRAAIGRDFARQLEEFGLLQPRLDGGERRYRETDAEIAGACGKLSRFGIDARHLRTFRTTADRQAALLEQLVAPALRSRNPERRQSGLEDMKALAAVSQELAQLLFWRDLRDVADR
jgi:DNA-binding transcriptional MerR regulator